MGYIIYIPKQQLIQEYKNKHSIIFRCNPVILNYFFYLLNKRTKKQQKNTISCIFTTEYSCLGGVGRDKGEE